MSEDDDYLTRGEVWLADLEPVQNLEQARARLVLIVSANTFNNGPAELLVVLPITTRKQDNPAHVVITSPEGGLNKDSYVLCERIQSISRDRLIKRLGRMEKSTMTAIEDRLCILMNLFEPR